VASALLIAPAAVRATDWLWYRDVGFERVFLLKIAAQWMLGLAVGLGGFVVLYINGRVALRGAAPESVPVVDRSRARPAPPAAFLTRLAGVLALPASALLGVLMALVAAAEWRTFVQFFHRSPFGVRDPVFGRDVAYYVFTVPVVESALGYVVLALTLALAAVAIPIYLARGEIALHGSRLRIDRRVAVHLGVLAALLLAVVGLRMLLVGVPSVLNAAHAPLQGASYTDLHVRIPMLRLTAALAIAAAAAVLWSAWHGRLERGAGVSLGAFAGAAMLLLVVVPAAFQRLVVQPNELAREAPQIGYHIAATRHAWGLDGVERRELGAEQRLTRADIADNQAWRVAAMW